MFLRMKFVKRVFPRGCNSSFVVLIPKVPDAKFVSDFRLISLISTFISNRQILDGPFIINELLSWCKSKKKQAMVFKVDFAKAYDSVRWDFLDDVLRSFGFGSKLRSWILGCLTSAMASVIVNGSPTSEVIEAGMFKGLLVDNSVMISHLFYVDDAIFVAKLQLRLSKWKSKTLSIGGRLTLLKAVLGASPIYVMSLYKVPKTVLKMMESIRSKFFNGVDGGEKKITWIKWSKVLSAKKNGGLGVSSFYALNRALLFKWVWRFISQEDSLWFRTICAIHGNDINRFQAGNVSPWVSILREVHSLNVRGIDLVSHCKKRVGDGLNTSFWHDNWIDDLPLKQKFPRVYALESNKLCTVADKRLAIDLDLSFRRNIQGGVESQQYWQLHALICSFIFLNSKDRWVLDLNESGDFLVKDVRSMIDDFMLLNDHVATRWIKCIPIKVNVFAWKVRHDRLATKNNLMLRGISVDSPLCPICSQSNEDVSHIFFCCDLAYLVSKRVCHWWDLDWQQFNSYMEWLSWLKSIRLGSNLKNILEGVFYISWWHIWNFRNLLIFADKHPRRSIIFDDIVARSFTWCSSRCNNKCSWETWIRHPNLISL
ncbi:RNA-directed DNA polymerase, eukaryota [Tanacetum coccineum]